MNNRILEEVLYGLIRGKSKFTPSGWYSFNCPACIHNGEPSPDTRSRGGLKFSPSGEISFHCFRCQYKAFWRPGKILDRKMRNLLLYMGMRSEEIQKLNFQIWRENVLLKNQEAEKNSEKTSFNEILKSEEKSESEKRLDFEEKKLPESFRIVDYWLEKNIFHRDFLTVMAKLEEQRGLEIFRNTELYWSPERKYSKSILIPFKYKGKIVGYALRNFYGKNKYIVEKPKDYLFQIENLFLPKRKYVILVEGVFDALAIKGVGILGNNLSEKQIDLINSSNKEIILFPDRDKGSSNLVRIAIENGWKVSIPLTENCPIEPEKNGTKILNCIWNNSGDIKDASDAVKKYGAVFTLKTIIDSAIDDPLRIELLRKSYYEK